LLKFIKAL